MLKHEKVLAGNEIDIIMTGYAAAGGISCILHSYGNEVYGNFPVSITEGAKKYSDNIMNDKPDQSITDRVDCTAVIYPAGEGGIFKALWDMAEEYRIGLAADLKSIPIRQEFIEICEYYHINPYMLNARGAHLIVTKCGNKMLRALESEGIKCAVIGYTMDNHDRIIINGEEIRYIDSGIEDELNKFGGIRK